MVKMSFSLSNSFKSFPSSSSKSWTFTYYLTKRSCLSLCKQNMILVFCLLLNIVIFFSVEQLPLCWIYGKALLVWSHPWRKNCWLEGNVRFNNRSTIEKERRKKIFFLICFLLTAASAVRSKNRSCTYRAEIF